MVIKQYSSEDFQENKQLSRSITIYYGRKQRTGQERKRRKNGRLLNFRGGGVPTMMCCWCAVCFVGCQKRRLPLAVPRNEICTWYFLFLACHEIGYFGGGAQSFGFCWKRHAWYNKKYFVFFLKKEKNVSHFKTQVRDSGAHNFGLHYVFGPESWGYFWGLDPIIGPLRRGTKGRKALPHGDLTLERNKQSALL